MAEPIKLLQHRNLYLSKTPYQLALVKKDSIDKRNGKTKYDSIRFYNNLSSFLTDFYNTFLILREPLYDKQNIYNAEDYKILHQKANDLLIEAMDNIKNAKNREEILNGRY